METVPANALEKRIADLLYLFRNECFDTGVPTGDPESALSSSISARKALALSQNIAFLVRNHRFKIEKKDKHKLATSRQVNPEDISIVVRGWNGNEVSPEGGAIAVMIRYPAMMQTVVRTKLQPGDDIIDKLYTRVDRGLLGIV